MGNMGGADTPSEPRLTEEILRSWDSVSIAINRVILAQPSQMTEAAERLRLAQLAHQDLLIKVGRHGR